MNRYSDILIVLIALAASALVPMPLSYGAGLTSVSFTETYDAGDPFEASVGPSPLPVALIDGDTGTSIYTINSEFDITNSTTLHTTASIILSTSTGDVLWDTVDAQAQAEASLVAFGFVQGVPQGATGTLQFNWNVSGNTRLLLEDLNLVNIDNFSALTTLQTTIPGAGGLPLNEQYSHSGSDPIDLDEPFAGTQPVFTVPYQEGTQVPVFFDLFSQVDLEVTNMGDGGFYAEGIAQFGNSAVLDSVLVLDEAGTEIPGATFELTVVPEPSSFVLVGLAVVVALTFVGRGVVKARRKARHPSDC